MAEITRTFSELWYRVADFAPRLSPHLIVRRHTYRNETWFVIGDPATSKFFRFNASAYRFLGLLDGRRTVHQAWEVCNAQLGDDAPSQTDCIDLLAQLQFFGLLRGDLPIDVQRLRERMSKFREHKFRERTGRFVFWTVPLINPERFLEKYANLARLVYGIPGAIVLATLFIFALRMIIPRWDEVATSVNSVIAPDNVFLLSLCFIILKVFHEFGHGFACKACGGRVTEIGLMFMIIVPIPYCDATASWGFPSKWRRILVSMGGILIELAGACLAAIVWASTDAGLVHTIAYNTMFVASVSTVIFNANPLLRYDGYYILADLLEIPNLSTRSLDLLKWIMRRYLFGLKGEPAPPLHDRLEGAVMVLHAACAFPYRILVILGIVLFVAQRYFVFGFLLGAVGLVVWFIVPIFMGLTYVLTEPTLQLVRPRAVTVTFGLLIAAILLVGVVPMPSAVQAAAVVEPDQYAALRAANDGFIRDLAYRNGEWIDAGAPVLVAHNPDIDLGFATATSAVASGMIQLDAAMSSSPADARYIEPVLKTAQALLDLATGQRDQMTVRSPVSGRFVAPDLESREGGFIKRGDPIGMVATYDDLVVRAYIDDADFAWLFRDGRRPSVKAKFVGMTGPTFNMVIVSEPRAGSNSIRYRSLGQTTQGGRIAVDPNDPQGRRTFRPQWEVVLRLAPPPPGSSSHPTLPLPGTRARVRFAVDPQPLVAQWWLRVRQAYAARFES